MKKKIDITLPEIFHFLFTPAPLKVAYGGRGSGKSYSFADGLIAHSLMGREKILCAREIQNSIKDSSHALIAQRIQEWQVGEYFDITDHKITCPATESEFLFAGLLRNVNSVKSIPKLTKAWVEEAENVSKNSWTVLDPTLREENAELWITFNPDWEENYTYDHYVTKQHQLLPGSIVQEVNYWDNPFFPDILRRKMEACKAASEDEYLNIWCGKPKKILEGAVYSNELRKCEQEGRVTHIAYDDSHPVHCALDLGHADFTSIWFFQIIAQEIRIIDFYEDSGHLITHYISYLRREKDYTYGIIYLPHDGRDNNVRGISIRAQFEQAGFTVKVTDRPQHKYLGIDAVRRVFNRLAFDREKTRTGRIRLARYRYGVNTDKETRTLQPIHDDSAHAADALQTLALGLRIQSNPATLNTKPKLNLKPRGNTGWMGS